MAEHAHMYIYIYIYILKIFILVISTYFLLATNCKNMSLLSRISQNHMKLPGESNIYYGIY